MKTYVALLRGINVGGRNSLPMKELVALLEALGCKSVKTYIQSGNVVLQSTDKATAQLSRNISLEIKKRRGFEPHVLLLEAKDLEQIIANNPFPEAETDPTYLHVGFLDRMPTNPDLEKLESLKSANERFCLNDNVFYLHAPDGVGRSKLAANAEKLLGVAMTDRNWRTVERIRGMVRELGA